jgi:hypothetical protein
MRQIAVFLVLFLSIPAASQVDSFTTTAGLRVVSPWQITKILPDSQQVKYYYFAPFRDIFQGTSYTSFMALGGTKVSFGGRYPWGLLYVLDVNGHYKEAWNILTADGTFFNMVPELPEEKMEPGIFSKLHRDSLTGKIKIIVQLHSGISDTVIKDSLYPLLDSIVTKPFSYYLVDSVNVRKIASLDWVYYVSGWSPPQVSILFSAKPRHDISGQRFPVSISPVYTLLGVQVSAPYKKAHQLSPGVYLCTRKPGLVKTAIVMFDR